MEQIDYEGLAEWLKTLTDQDFQEGVKIRKGYSIGDIELFKPDKTKIALSDVIFYGDVFLLDLIGNDLSIVTLTKRNYKAPNGRVIGCRLKKTVIFDCHKHYGTALNGYWMIPDRFLTGGVPTTKAK